MSFGFGVGDIVTCSRLAVKTYDALKSAPSEFADLRLEIGSLNSTLKALAEEEKSPTSLIHLSTPSRRADLRIIIENCKTGLEALQSIASKYHSLAPSEKTSIRELLRFAAKDKQGLREKLAIHTSSFNIFLTSLTHSSLGRLEFLLKNSRQSTNFGTTTPGPYPSYPLFRQINTNVSANAVPHASPNTGIWSSIGSELAAEGITDEHATRFQEEIKSYMRHLVRGEVPFWTSRPAKGSAPSYPTGSLFGNQPQSNPSQPTSPGHGSGSLPSPFGGQPVQGQGPPSYPGRTSDPPPSHYPQEYSLPPSNYPQEYKPPHRGSSLYTQRAYTATVEEKLLQRLAAEETKKKSITRQLSTPEKVAEKHEVTRGKKSSAVDKISSVLDQIFEIEIESPAEADAESELSAEPEPAPKPLNPPSYQPPPNYQPSPIYQRPPNYQHPPLPIIVPPPPPPPSPPQRPTDPAQTQAARRMLRALRAKRQHTLSYDPKSPSITSLDVEASQIIQWLKTVGETVPMVSVWLWPSCDACDLPIVNVYFHCRTCQLDDWDVCETCYEQGKRCLDARHRLQERDAAYIDMSTRASRASASNAI